MKSVYCKVRTEALNKAVCALSLNGYLRTNSDFCHLQHKLIGFITEMKSVYCTVRTETLNKNILRFVFKWLSENKEQLVPLTA
jgi:hypothetical protein